MQEKTRRKTDRRGFLKVLSSSLGITAGMSGLSSGKNDSLGPAHARGQRIYTYRPSNGDNFICNERFISPELGKYGTNSVHFEQVEISREIIPEEHKNPDRAFTKRRKGTAIIGTPEEHVKEENQIRKSSSTESATTQATYTGPLYTYRSVEGASNGDVQERESPINTAWSNDLTYNTASEIRDVFQATMNWNQSIPTDIQNSTRYVNISDSSGTLKQRSSDAEAMDEIDVTKQWHVRLYNIGDYKYSNHSVIGQAHVDPYDHGLRKYLHLLPYVDDLSVNWHFDEARERVLDDWGYNGFSYTRNDIGNDSFNSDDSHNGEIGLISN